MNNIMQLHPLCSIFPRIEGQAFDDLVADIKANGLREPITVHDGMILDGGNRFRACEIAGVAPHFVEFDGSNVAMFVLSKNLNRRHLTEGQRAAVVSSVAAFEQAFSHGGGGRKTQRGQDQEPSVVLDNSLQNQALTEKNRFEDHFQSAADRAKIAGVSLNTQKKSDRVAKESPEKLRAVIAGETTLNKALSSAKPAKEKEPEFEEYEGPTEEEVKEALAWEEENNSKLFELMNSDDPLGAALAEVKRLKAEVTVLKLSRDGYLNANGEMIRTIKGLRRKLEKAGIK